MNRRNFLKAGGATAASVSLIPSLLFGRESNRYYAAATHNSGLRLPGYPTTCNACPAGCGLLAFRNGNRMTTLLGHPLHPVNRGKLCAVGAAGKNLYHDPFRLLHPKKRVGRRGGGEWEDATWEEAETAIGKALVKALSGTGGPNFAYETGAEGLLTGRFAAAVGGRGLVREVISPSRVNLDAAGRLMFGEEAGDFTFDPADLEGGLVINFGADPFGKTDKFPFAAELADAVVKGKIRLVTIDPRLSATAARSSTWLPVNPGGDMVLALALAHVLMRVHGLGDDIPGMPGEQLWRHLAEYRPDWSARRCGVSNLEIRKLAHLASSGPTAVLAGGGVSGQGGGFEASRAVLLLDLLLGGRGSAGSTPLPRPAHPAPRSRKSALLDAARGDRDLDLFIAARFNPVYDGWGAREIRKMLLAGDDSPVGTMVAVDTHMTETAALSDWVLPAATFFESWGLRWIRGSHGRPALTLTQPVMSPVDARTRLRRKDRTIENLMEDAVAPLGESRTHEDFLLYLAGRAKLTGTAPLLHSDAPSYIREELDRIPGLSGSDFDAFRETGYFTLRKTPRRPRTSEPVIYSMELRQAGGAAFPAEIGETTTRNKEMSLITYTPEVHTERTGGAKWLAEIFHDNPAWMNPETAAGLGLAEGDYIYIHITRGPVRKPLHVRLRLTEGLAPGTVAVARNAGHKEFGPVARAEKAESPDRDTSHVWWEEETNGVNVARILPGEVAGVPSVPWVTAVPVLVARAGRPKHSAAPRKEA